jgi:hypothetical protein
VTARTAGEDVDRVLGREHHCGCAMVVSLGRSPAENPKSDKQAAAATTQDASSLIYPDELIGMSLPKAAEAVLLRFSPPPHRRSLKTTDLVGAIRKRVSRIK